MAALQIRPHSRCVSGLAVLGLTLLAAASFTAGLTRQIGAANAPSPFPAAQEASPQVATVRVNPAPAGDFQVAARTPPPRHAAPQDTAAAVPVDVEPVAAPSAEPLPATDASATAPDPPATPPAPPSQDPPNV